MRCQCPKLVLLLLLLSLLGLPLLAAAQGFCAYRMREHATDCLSLTDGRLCDLCYEQDSSRLFVCQPSVIGETCSGGEWRETVFLITDAAVPDTITAINYLLLSGGTLTGPLTTSNLGIALTASDTNPACSAGNFSLFADLSETQLKQCVNGVVSPLGSGGGTIPASAAPVVDAVGELALDTDLWGNSHGALVFFDGLVTIKSLGFPATEACDTGHIPKFDADTSTWGCAADEIGTTSPVGDDAFVFFDASTPSESDWYQGANHDSAGDDDDCLEFRQSPTPGTNVRLSICPDGTITTPASAASNFEMEMFESTANGTGSILLGINGNIANSQKDCRFDLTGEMPDGCLQGVSELVTLSGVAENAVHLGTFTGTTIADNSVIKVALQALETAVEAAGGGPVTFDDLGTGNNTSATMTVSGTASIVPSGTGVITATGGTSGFTVGTVTDPADTGGVNFDNAANGPCWEASPASATDVCLVANAAEQVSVVGGTLDISSTKVSGTVRRSIYLRADAFYMQGNCVLVTDTAPISAGLVHPYITCADVTGDNFHTNFLMPDCWDGGTVTVEAMAWITTATGTTTLNWSGESVADNETVGTDISDTGGQNTTFTHTSYTANDEAHVTSPAITVNGAGAGEQLYLEARTTAFTAGFRFGGVKLEYLCNQSGD